ncbi:MAG: hypothetical protein ACXABE_07655 [Candidatus Thorarchaeota archaeon]|jgi:hypothetical protein
MKKSDEGWVRLANAGLVLIIFAGFYSGVPTWLDYLDYGLLAGGVTALIFAAYEFQRRNKVSTEENSDDTKV